MEVKPDFPRQEAEVLEYWRENDTFQETVRRNQDKPQFNFYDGPPFATGLPHYGHILAGTIKDVVTRYAHQTGYHVPRRAGWDTHGLPVEYEIDKTLGIQSKQEVLDMGIEEYNRQCRAIVMRYSQEWRETVERTGRWIDFDNDYKTMNPKFMESVWWVFKTLHDKGLIYRSTQIMPYSTACNTPLSNFEVQQNYQMVTDPAITVAFQVHGTDNTYLLAWTTTPWSLVGDLALAVHPELEYSEIEVIAPEFSTSLGHHYILLTSKLAEFLSEAEYRVVATMSGSQLEGTKYHPLFNFYADSPIAPNAFRVLAGEFVSDETGTGVVHIAPAFGDEDHKVCVGNGVLTSLEVENYCPVGPNGRLTAEAGKYAGMYFKDADKQICKDLKEKGRSDTSGHGFIFKQSQVHHQYPYCWRSDTPLMYRVMSSWFLDVPAIKERLIANSMNSRWVPETIQTKRFLNWLENARPWNISRNRFWGNPLPVWANEDYSEIVVIGSIAELERSTGSPAGSIKDLHRESIDHLTIPSRNNPEGPPLRRIEEVMDCWLESGCMPYAQAHYPFENKEQFENSGFPGDFIAEGLDQTRGWFYTLMVISTALFDKPAFKNLIVNGIVLAEDGRKMSKRLKNYPEPNVVLDTHGADALRLYLIDSPVVRAESLRFSEQGVHNITRSVLIPWYNSVRFFLQNVPEVSEAGEFYLQHSTVGLSNPMDYWIYYRLSHLRDFVVNEMENYRLYTIVPAVTEFLNNLNNHYIRFNRLRLKGEGGNGSSLSAMTDQSNAIRTLYYILYLFGQIMAPFTPFASEYFFQKLNAVSSESEEHSVHLLCYPAPFIFSHFEFQHDPEVVDLLVDVVESGRSLRDNKKISLRTPLSELVIYTNLDLSTVEQYISDELNIKKVTVTPPISDQIQLKANPDYKALGRKFGSRTKEAIRVVSNLTTEQISQLQIEGNLVIESSSGGNSITIEKEGLASVQQVCINPDPNVYLTDIAADNVMILLNYNVTPDLQLDGDLRTLYSAVKQLRKKAGLNPSDVVVVYSNASSVILEKLKERYSMELTSYSEDSKPKEYTVHDQISPLGGGTSPVDIYL